MTEGLVLLYAQRDDGFMLFRIRESLSARRAFPQMVVTQSAYAGEAE
jgi:hypothetical protein